VRYIGTDIEETFPHLAFMVLAGGNPVFQRMVGRVSALAVVGIFLHVSSALPQYRVSAQTKEGGRVHGQRDLKIKPQQANGQLLIADFDSDGDGQVDGFGYLDKQRVDGSSTPLQIVVTNTSDAQTVNVTGVTATAPYSATTDCKAVGPGQSCHVLVSFTATTVCEDLGLGMITLADDDPGGDLLIEYDGIGADASVQIDDLTDLKLTAAALAQNLVGAGVQISNVTYTGSARAAGKFTSSSNILGFTNGIVLSSGSVRNVVGPNCNDTISVASGQPGDADLNTIVGTGNTTNDAAVLEFDFVPTSSVVSFQYAFTSDEYNGFVGAFNDVFGFFLTDKSTNVKTNIALIPGTTLPVSINNVNDGNPGSIPPVPPTNPQFYINNEFIFPTVAPLDTEMNGVTVVFTAQAQVVPNNAYHIKLAIADANDFELDSDVFLQSGSLVSSTITMTPGTLAFGNQAVGTTSALQAITVTNVGPQVVTLSSIVASANFAETNACPATLSAVGTDGSSCVVNVSFAPGASGSLTGSLTVTYTTPTTDTPQTQIATLTGTGTGSASTVIVAPASLTFAQQALGTTSPAQTVAVTNTGTAIVNFTSIAASGDFAVTGSTGNFCSTDGGISAGASCTIMVTFTPTAAGVRTGTLTIADSATGSPQTVTLTGNGGSSSVIITVPSGGSTMGTTTPGGTAFFGLLITGGPGVTGTVQLSCLSPSPFITCTVIPSTITLNGTTTEVAFGIQTFCKGTTTTTGFVPGGFGGGMAMMLGAMMLGAISVAFSRNRRVAMVFATLTILAALGVGSCASLPKGPNGATPAGTYPITLVSTLNGQTQTLANFLTLVVK
jgi:Abnormal spindle-like microcephaly-assoc'd, ASPM-SPD-2-Hydin